MTRDTCAHWLLRSPQRHARLRLFCFSHAGGAPTSFIPWQAALGQTVEVCAVQLPGRGQRSRELPYREFRPLVFELAGVIESMSDLPCIFYGHSLGALLAFEVARLLHGSALLRHLFVAGCSAPQMRQPGRRIHELDDAGLIEVLRDYGGTPPEVLEHEELIQLLLPLLRADFALVSDYRYQSGRVLNIPLSVLAGRTDPDVPAEHVECWSVESSIPLEIHWFDGGHFFPATHRDAVLACIRKRIPQAISA